MSETQRASVLLNLIEIARADGEISTAEDAFIAENTETLNTATPAVHQQKGIERSSRESLRSMTRWGDRGTQLTP